MKDEEMINKQFGRWKVLDIVKKYKNGKTYCKCECSCSKHTVKMVYKNSLLNGDSKSCGCLNSELVVKRCRTNRIGERFGFLVVIEMLYNYHNAKTYCVCKCDCGETTISSLSNLVTGSIVSCGCKSVDLRWNGKRTDLIGTRFGNLVVTEMLYGYKNSKTYCRCNCDCGEETIVNIGNLKGGRTRSCGCMENKSVGERVIKEILKQHNIDFISQKTFNDCRNILPLPFDFYLPNYNTCIEYDGIQHFKPIEFFGGKEGFEQRKYNDEIKTKYCLSHNINLIRLPYTLSDLEIEKQILNIWNP